jgi:hypothetical protein
VESTSFWQAYVDNLDVGEVVHLQNLEALRGTRCPQQDIALKNYDISGAAGNPDEDVLRQSEWQSLGCRGDGIRGRLEPPEN